MRRKGGQALKLNPTTNAGVPDRLFLLPGGLVLFVEFKAPNKTGRRTQRQLYWANTVEELGHHYLCTNSLDDFKTWVDSLLDEVTRNEALKQVGRPSDQHPVDEGA